MTRKLLALVSAFLVFTLTLTPLSAAAQLSNASVLATCGTAAYPTPATRAITQDTSGKLCSSAGGSSGGTSPFLITGNATRTATTSSARVALPTSDPVILITNTGTGDAYFKLGDVTVTAATTDTLLGSGRAISVAIGTNTNLAAITASGSTSLAIAQGTGTPVIAGGGGAAAAAAAAAGGGGVVFVPTSATSNTSLSATTSSASVALPTGALLQIKNTGTVNEFITFGVGSATATTSGYEVDAGTIVYIAPGANTFMAAITAAGSTTNSIAGGQAATPVIPTDNAGNQLAPGNVQSVNLSGAAATLMLAPSTPTTYYFSKTGLALATGASDFLEIYGAGTLVTRILWLKVSCTATAAATVDISFIRRTTQLTGGTKTTVTPVPADNFLGFVNASSTVNIYTVNSSGGGSTSSGGGEIYSQKAYVGPIASPVASATQVVFSGMDALTGNVPLLRATTQTLTATANTGNGVGTVCDIAGAFTELAS